MKMMYICICSGFYKQEWILLKFGMHLSIGCSIMENENTVTGKSKNLKKNQKTFHNLFFVVFTCFRTSKTKFCFESFSLNFAKHKELRKCFPCWLFWH